MAPVRQAELQVTALNLRVLGNIVTEDADASFNAESPTGAEVHFVAGAALEAVHDLIDFVAVRSRPLWTFLSEDVLVHGTKFKVFREMNLPATEDAVGAEMIVLVNRQPEVQLIRL